MLINRIGVFNTFFIVIILSCQCLIGYSQTNRIQIECQVLYPDDTNAQYDCYVSKTNELIDSIQYNVVNGWANIYKKDMDLEEAMEQITFLIEERLLTKQIADKAINKLIASTLKVEGYYKKSEWRELSLRKDQKLKSKHIKGFRFFFSSVDTDERDFRIVIYDNSVDRNHSVKKYTFNMRNAEDEMPIRLDFDFKSKHDYKVSIQSKGEEIAYTTFGFK